MERNEFQATEGLLEDVMRKQAGTLEKAVLEAIMNSVDAGASYVNVEVEEDHLLVEDNGSGMTQDEVKKYFKKFGLKDSDIEEKEFGKFRMGRGQIFNFGRNIWHTGSNLMVVDLNNDKSTVTIEGEETTVDTSGLSYGMAEVNDSFDGCSISVELYKTLDDVDETVNSIVELAEYIPWLHDISLTVNGEEIDGEFDYDKETETAYYKIGTGDWRTRHTIFNKGARVKEFSLNRTGGVVVTKKDLDVNFSRNDILDTCEVWNTVKDEVRAFTLDHIEEKTSPSSGECDWVLNKMAEDHGTSKRFSDVELIRDVRGNRWSVEQLSGQSIAFAASDNKLVQNAEKENDVIAIKQQNASHVRNLMSEANPRDISEYVKDEMKWEMRDYDYGRLSKRRQDNLDLARWFFGKIGFGGEVEAGYSKTFDIWKTDDGDLYFHKDKLNENKSEFRSEVLLEAVRYAANNGPTVEGVEDDHKFRSNLSRLYEEIPEAIMELQTGNPHK